MTYRVMLREKSPNGYVATALAWPECVVEAPTREEALARIRVAIAELLAEAEIVEVDVPVPHAVIAAPYAETFGMFRDDPTFDDFVEEVQKYRNQRE